MNAFLLSDLVVHELVSMQLEGRWLTAAQFWESARLWLLRCAPHDQASERSLRTLENAAIRIAKKLMEQGGIDVDDSPPGRFFLDSPVVNYADPVCARALAASVEACARQDA
jgi:hypothetical protein